MSIQLNALVWRSWISALIPSAFNRQDKKQQGGSRRLRIGPKPQQFNADRQVACADRVHRISRLTPLSSPGLKQHGWPQLHDVAGQFYATGRGTTLSTNRRNRELRARATNDYCSLVQTAQPFFS